MRTNYLLTIALCGVILLLTLPPASAEPIIFLNNASTFGAAISNGYITGLTPNASNALTTSNKAALAQIYPGSTTSYRDTSVSTNVTPVNGLVSATGSSADAGNSLIGSWSYKGPDPDYTQFTIDLDLFFPEIRPASGTSGIDRFAFAVVDTSDRVRFWSWDSTALTTGFDSFHFGFASGAGAAGSTGFGSDPGFDITQASLLQISYRGTLGSTYPNTPSGSQALWLGTHTFEVVPEPGAGAAALIGTILAAAVGRRHVRRRLR